MVTWQTREQLCSWHRPCSQSPVTGAPPRCIPVPLLYALCFEPTITGWVRGWQQRNRVVAGVTSSSCRARASTNSSLGGQHLRVWHCQPRARPEVDGTSSLGRQPITLPPCLGERHGCAAIRQRCPLTNQVPQGADGRQQHVTEVELENGQEELRSSPAPGSLAPTA